MDREEEEEEDVEEGEVVDEEEMMEVACAIAVTGPDTLPGSALT